MLAMRHEMDVTLQSERLTSDHLARFEAWAALYFRRFNRLAPGKSDPMDDSNSDENVARCAAWHASGLAAHDAIEWVVELESALERASADTQETAGALVEALRVAAYWLQDTQDCGAAEFPKALAQINAAIARATPA
jgi:hypothetical protein